MRYVFLIIVIILSVIYFIDTHYTEDYKVIGKVVDKNMVSGTDGNMSYYHTFVLYDDGDTDDLTDVESYIKLEKDVRYTFNRKRFNFYKK